MFEKTILQKKSLPANHNEWCTLSQYSQQTITGLSMIWNSVNINKKKIIDVKASA